MLCMDKCLKLLLSYLSHPLLSCSPFSPPSIILPFLTPFYHTPLSHPLLSCSPFSPPSIILPSLLPCYIGLMLTSNLCRFQWHYHDYFLFIVSLNCSCFDVIFAQGKLYSTAAPQFSFS